MNPDDVVGIVMSVLATSIVLVLLGLAATVYWIGKHD